MPELTTLHFTDAGDGPPLVLIHGLFVRGAMFDPLIPLLEPERRLIVPDLRGHGASSHLPPPYSAPQHAADLARLLDELGIARADVLGYSQGGAAAQQFAKDFPDRVARLILVCTFAHNLHTPRERLEGWLMPRLLRWLGVPRLAALTVRAAPELSPEGADRLQAMIAANQPDRALAAIRALQAFDSRAWLRQITCPTLIVAGARDSAVPLHHAHMLAEGIAGARLEVIDGAGHTLIWTHPAALAAAVRRHR